MMRRGPKTVKLKPFKIYPWMFTGEFTIAELILFAYIYENDGIEISITNLAYNLGTSAANMTVRIHKSEEKGFIRRDMSNGPRKPARYYVNQDVVKELTRLEK